MTNRPFDHGITPHPAIEAARLQITRQLQLLTLPVPLWLAEAVHERTFPYSAGEGDRVQTSLLIGRRQIAFARRKAAAVLTYWGWTRSAVARQSWATSIVGAAEPAVDPVLRREVQNCLAARRLTEDELRSSLAKQGVGQRADLRIQMHLMVISGLVRRVGAVGAAAFGRLQCRRCGSEHVQVVWCARCGGDCPQCLDCRNMGVTRGCSPLYSLTAQTTAANSVGKSGGPVELHLPFTLSAAQRRAAAEIECALQQGKRRILVWAACGAGKTEVVYGAIQNTLAQSGRVLLATPRRDVTAELCTRLQSVFGQHNVVGLYSGAEAEQTNAPVLVATTHQTLRLDSAFGLVILDECDAFPYANDAALQRAVARLVAPNARFIQMTATPSQMLRQAHQNHLSACLVHIPARHHGYPLPVPQIVTDAALQSWQTARTGESPTDNIPAGAESARLASPTTPGAGLSLVCPNSLVQALVHTRCAKAQLLVFVPYKALVAPLAHALRRVGIGRVAGVCAGSAERDAIRAAFAGGELEAVVATTIFERGLTFPHANVAVFLADTPKVFDCAALVQMAGRVGRTSARPEGDVWFLCIKETVHMRQAVSDIRQLNVVAAQGGLLR